MSVIVSSVKSRKDLKHFIMFPWQIYKRDPAWVPPLIGERRNFLNSKKNPFFEHGEAELFLAKRGGEVVGRISAQVDFLHNQVHQERTGFFGFFESINDHKVARALLDKAADWLSQRKMNILRGPFSFNINDESGCLIEGFSTPPYFGLCHNPPYYGKLLENYGLAKKKDILCWVFNFSQPMPKVLDRVSKRLQRKSGFSLHEITSRTVKSDSLILRRIFNSAWKNNWGFIPLTKRHVLSLANKLKPFLEPKLALIGRVNGEPEAIFFTLPNINEALRDLNGRLFPFGFLKLLFRIKRKKIKTNRILLMGINEGFRIAQENPIKGVLAILSNEIYHRSLKLGIKETELSWTLEDNYEVNNSIKNIGGRHYKTYRIYEKNLL